MYGCPYLNFSRSTSDMDLITRRVIRKREGENDINMLETYSDPDTPEYNAMVEEMKRNGYCQHCCDVILKYAANNLWKD